jgi:hypothetical protein
VRRDGAGLAAVAVCVAALPLIVWDALRQPAPTSRLRRIVGFR